MSARDSYGTIQTVTIPAGTGARALAWQLQGQGIIRSAFVFTEYAALTGQASRLQAGTYQLCACQSVQSIVRTIAEGNAVSTDIQITIPEGSTVWQIDRIIVAAGIGKAGDFAKTYHTREGGFFPDTYRIAKGATQADVVEKLKAEFLAKASGYTLSQVVVASILEREAKTPADMALVAGIIKARIAKGMPLQIDATVAYGWCVRRAQSQLSAGFAAFCDTTQAPIASELKIDGPYNTYSRQGLPAAPISNPGLAALEAAAHPKDSPYLYYLSTRDGSQIIYAKTAAEHLANRQKYLGF